MARTRRGEPGTPRAPRYPVESVDNALRLLLLFRDSSTVTVAAASRVIKVAPSTAHRLLAMLQYHGLVRHDAQTRTYHPGRVLTDIGLAALREFDIRAVMRPALELLVERTGETAHLAVLRRSSVVFLDCVETDKVLRATSRTGRSLPAHATANGKAQLATLPDDAVRGLFRSESLPRVTGSTLPTRSALLDQLGRIRRTGYATNLGESEENLVAVACAIVGPDGIAHGSIAVAGPDVRIRASDIRRIGAIVKEVAAEAGSALPVSPGSQ